MSHLMEAACINRTGMNTGKTPFPGLETLHTALSAIASGAAFRLLLNGMRTLDHKAAALFETPAADIQPRRAAEDLNTLLSLPQTGSMLHFEAGDGAFLEAFHALHPGWELSALESGGAFMDLIRKDFLSSACNADYQDADITRSYDLIVVTRPLDELAKPLHAVRWLSRHLAPNGVLALWQPSFSRPDVSLCGAVHGLNIRILNLTTLCKAAGLHVGELTTQGHAICLCARKNSDARIPAGSQAFRAARENA